MPSKNKTKRNASLSSVKPNVQIPENTRVPVLYTSQVTSGPLPDPEVMAKYENVLPVQPSAY
jgi:hypothetical protein